MDDRTDSETESDSTLMMCEKRSSMELGESAGHTRKRVKMRDLESVVRDEEILNHYPKTTSVNDKDKQFYSIQGEMSQITKDDDHLGVSVEATGRKELFPSLADITLKPLDLNIEVSQVKSFGSGDTLRTCNRRKSAVLRTKDVEPVNSRISGSDNYSENFDDVSSSVNQDRCFMIRKHDVLKSKPIPNEPLERKDPHVIWKEMKQNGFLSSSQHGCIPIQKQHSGISIPKQHGGIPMPKQRGRKSNDESMKKNMEIAKKKEVDRFAKMAAPSGLLSKLNPGIITNVRNMKQVRSIIQSLVRSEKLDAESKQGSELKSGRKEISGIDMDKENMIPSTLQRSFPQKKESYLCPFVSMETTGQQIRVNEPISSCFEDQHGGDAACILNSDYAPDDDDFLALKLTSSTALASPSSIPLPREENSGSVSSLSVKAATIASQWLELLHQDIKGRLGALRRSKKRLRAVLQTELPIIYAQEFAHIQEDGPSLIQTSGCSRKAIADMHHTRWDRLFDQMDKGLYEEEKKMEEWLNQVGEMLHHCAEGLQLNQSNESSCFQLQGMCGNKSRCRLEKMDKTEGELAIRAAAASIYSTCNYLLSVQQGTGL